MKVYEIIYKHNGNKRIQLRAIICAKSKSQAKMKFVNLNYGELKHIIDINKQEFKWVLNQM